MQPTFRRQPQAFSRSNNRRWSVGSCLVYGTGITLVGTGCALFLFPELRDSLYYYVSGVDRKEARAKRIREKRERRKVKKSTVAMKALQRKFEGLLVDFRKAQVEVFNCVRSIGCMEGEEISTPFGRAIARKWREADGIVVSDLLWGGRLYARPDRGALGAASGESGVEGSSYYFFRSDGKKIRNKWDSYNIEEELRKLDDVDGGDESEAKEAPAGTPPRRAPKAKTPERILQAVGHVILEIERLQLSLDGITVPRDYKGADKLRENRKKFHGNIEVTLNEAESTLKLGKRWMEALKQFSQQ